MIEVGKDLLRSSGPTSLLKQQQLEKIAQFCVQLGFEYLPLSPPLLWEAHACLSPLSQHNCFLVFRCNFLYLALCPLTLVLLLHATKQSLSHVHSLKRRYLYTLIRPSLSLLFSRLKCDSSLSPSSYDKCSNLSTSCVFVRFPPESSYLSCVSKIGIYKDKSVTD